jgi:hypothetical protein
MREVFCPEGVSALFRLQSSNRKSDGKRKLPAANTLPENT